MGDELQAAEDSLLGDLRGDLEKAQRRLHLDLRIPRVEPPLFVRFTPMPKSVLDKANESIRDSKDDDRVVVANAVALTHVCAGVFREGTDGRPAGNPEQWPKFDQRLAGMLGLPADCGAVAVVRKLYLTDGDVIAACADVAEWSAQTERRAQEEHEGN